MIAQIAVSTAAYAIDKPYSYRIPVNMDVKPGQRVQLPFGRSNRSTEGVVLGLCQGDESKLKPIERVLDQQPILTETQLKLAAFLRDRYFCTFYDAVRAMLPAGLWFKTTATFSLTEDRSWQTAEIRKVGAREILDFLETLGGSAEETALRKVFPEDGVLEDIMPYLSRKKWVRTEKEFLRRTNDKVEKIAQLATSPEEAMEFASHRPKSASMQKAVMEQLCSLGSVSVKELCYFTGATSQTIKRLEKLGYITLIEQPKLRCRQIKPQKLDGPLVLNEDQEGCYQGLRQQMDGEKPGVALLYGVTGSGKTSIYIKLIRHCLDTGRSAQLLVPEIALTPQLLGLLAAHFGDQVAVLHSSLGASERYDQWKRVRSGEAKVVVGTRSAVFAPCVNLSLIILDEEQEHSYKSENNPRYGARDVAIWRGIKEKALVLLGSATPSVETMYHAKQGDYQLYQLHNRYNGRPLPKVEIVDMQEELKMGNDLSLSYPLREAICDNLQVNRQTVLLLNRRGNSRALQCVDCREIPECPRCSVKLTYHSANNRLMCHYCGFSQPAPQRCPKCGGPMKTMGTGTQKVELELKGLFPNMEIDRMDADTVSAVNTHEKILDHFQENQVPVLLGTQMVAKGLNLPKVTLVGVLDADLSLYTGGYHAGETTFNILTQVVGRAGRGEDSGRALIQTLVPDHKIIQLAARQDYDGFYNLEIGLRRVQNLPPFGDLAVITVSGEEETKVLRGCVKLRDSLVGCLKDPRYREEHCTVLGPAPCVVPKVNYHYRYRLTLSCKMTRELRLLISWLLREFLKDRENRGGSAFIDVNGFDG